MRWPHLLRLHFRVLPRPASDSSPNIRHLKIKPLHCNPPAPTRIIETDIPPSVRRSSHGEPSYVSSGFPGRQGAEHPPPSAQRSYPEQQTRATADHPCRELLLGQADPVSYADD